MARRRLATPTPDQIALARAAQRPQDTPGPLSGPLPPIARIVGEAGAEQAQEIAKLKAEAEAMARAQADGRVLVDIGLAAVDTGYLARDRMADEGSEDEEMRALKASIRAHGQRVPIEVAAMEDGAARPFGLIAGWRRLQALKALHAETGEDRFATIRAILRAKATLPEAFLSMVEENEVRANLSYYERGRICVLAAERGAFPDATAASEALFAAASPAKRSKIRSFQRIHEELGHVLVWPQAIPERLGLKIAQALKWGQGAALAEALDALRDRHATPEAEQAAILAALDAAKGAPAAPAAPSPKGHGARRSPDPGKALKLSLAPGVTLERRSFATHTDLRLTGLTEEQLEAAIAALQSRLAGEEGSS
ncbi:ParB N-terminal domain-containing protein [Rhodobacteraceae bacterium NNCM2]|nr:ParB N-terminal domain-containing protein [Coraliihabitans acroporae]